MKVEKLSNMKNGWFIGNFEPSLFKTNNVEIAIKSYSAGDYEEKHFHKIATEYTVIIKGRVQMFNNDYSEGDIIIAEPGDVTDFIAITDSVNVVVKLPGANDDKYLVMNDSE